MRASALIPIGGALAFALAPSSLIVVGNLVGTSGYLFLLVIGLATLVHCCTANTYRIAARLFPGPASEARLIGAVWGALSRIALPLAARWPLAVVFSTSLLVTAGYVFNEVFVGWFPNLGFSFLLLACLTVINLAGEKSWCFCQRIFLGITVCALLAVMIAGAMAPPLPATTASVADTIALPLVVAGIFIFLGFDLAVFLTRAEGISTPHFVTALILSALVLSCWGLVSGRQVEATRLAESSLPHMLAAKAILGEPGRWLMGAAVIGGTCAAVNMLFQGLTKMTIAVAGLGPRSAWMARRPWGRCLPPLVLAAFIAAMLGSGMGGESILDTWITGGFWLWLAHHGLINAALIAHRRTHSREPATPPIRLQHAYLASAMICVVLVGALIVSPYLEHHVAVIAAGLAGGFLIAYACGGNCRLDATAAPDR